MGLLYYLSYLAVLAAFAFVTLSLASGLLYISELVEEHSRLAKVIGQRGIHAIIALHVILYFSDSLPFLYVAFSVVCHIVYLQNFSTLWPLISLSSISFLASCFFVIADHFLWFFYFSRITSEARQSRTYRGPLPNVLGFTEIASFFGICVWLAPLFLFLSLSANDNALPVSAGSPSALQYAQSRVSLFRSLCSFESLPRMRLKPSRRNTTEGILASHSPTQSLSPMPPGSPSPSLTPRYAVTPPPRSPGPPRLQEESHPLSQSFKLGTPRRTSQPLRRQTGTATDQTSAGLGIGLRRATSGTAMDEGSMLRER
ncbi:DUF396-domain-containing protein [Tricholoma matsutake]|nr:DUF396-domain-containing protein [Tricholoma matsutake 945]